MTIFSIVIAIIIAFVILRFLPVWLGVTLAFVVFMFIVTTVSDCPEGQHRDEKYECVLGT